MQTKLLLLKLAIS